MSFKSEILKYENKIFTKYLQKRKLFINVINNFDFNELNTNQLLNFTFDTKIVIDPIKTSIENITQFLKNEKNSFINENSINYDQNLKKILVFYSIFHYHESHSSESDPDSISSNFLDNSSISNESSESESDSESESESESE